MLYKYIGDGCIIGVGTGIGANCSPITEEEYDKVCEIINNRPVAPEGYYYILNENLEWDLKEKTELEDGEVVDEF